MLKRQLGHSNIQVSAMGLGCWAIGGPWTFRGHQAGWGTVNDKESIRAIHRALDLGINFFDTAANYGCGHSERILGRAVAGRRSDVVIATKFGYLVDEEAKAVTLSDDVVSAVHQDCEDSLRRLNVDYIDLLQFHVGDYDPGQAAEVRDVLEELVAEGKVRTYGWSTDDVERARVFAQGPNCAAVQHRLNVLQDTPEMLALCEEFNLASVNRGPLLRGILTGKFTADSTFPENDIRHGFSFKEGQGAELLERVAALREVLTQGDRTLPQAALGWIWARDERTIPIPGFKTVAQAEENIKALELGPLSDEQMQQIDEILDREPATKA